MRSSLARSTSRGFYGIDFSSIIPWLKCLSRLRAEERPAMRCVSYLELTKAIIWGITLVTFSSLRVFTRLF